jgi:hypothetical protein
MSDTSRSCARCRRPAVIARGNLAYCMDCNRVLEWSQVIAVVQNVDESANRKAAGVVATAVNDDLPIEFTATDREPVLTGGGGESVEADPFAQRLA